jgi:hypothetical protein
MGQILLFSVTAMANPTLVGITTVMLVLPSPQKLMLAYLIGAYAMSITLGIVIVRAEQDAGLVEAGKQTINPVLDLVLGMIVLIIGLLLRSGRDRPVRERRAERQRDKPPSSAPS